MINTGTNPPIKMIEYLRKQAKPRKLFPADPQEVLKKMPTMSVQQISARNEAKQAANRGFYTPANNINPNMLEERRGELLARRDGGTRTPMSISKPLTPTGNMWKQRSTISGNTKREADCMSKLRKSWRSSEASELLMRKCSRTNTTTLRKDTPNCAS